MKYLFLPVVLLFSGCATIPGFNTDDGVAGVAKQIKPEYAGTIDQITDILVGKRVNPVEGFAREERWFVKGEEVNSADIKMEVVYKRDYVVTETKLVPGSILPPTVGPEPSNAELKAEIEAILDAAGVIK